MARILCFHLLILLCITVVYSKDAELVYHETNMCSSTVEAISDSSNGDHKSSSMKPVCPLWHYCKDSYCECADCIYNFVQCNNSKKTSVLDCNCITYNEEQNVAELGKCIFNCAYSNYSSSLFLPLPSNVKEVNEAMCGAYNRTGTLCGKCKDGHYPLAYSFDMNCVECPNGKSNWWKFALAAFVPLTIWYIAVLLLRISVTSSQLHGFVLCIQGISMPAMARVSIITTKDVPYLQKMVRYLGSLYGVWNLDFFRLLNFNICLGTDTLQTLSLDYLVGIYPFLLMIVTYFLIDQYDRNCKLLIVAWKPFHKVLAIFRKKWDIRTSLVDAFTTFFLLSNVKFLSVSFDILTPVKVYYQLNSTGKISHTWRVFSDATLPYFGEGHLPYALLATAVLVLLVFFPILLLALYPFSWFQKFLNYFPFRWYILHTIMDSFQGCYKDGTEQNTRDCRWFASMFLLLRLCIFLIGGITASVMYFVFTPMLLAIVAFLLLRINPFKDHLRNYTDINAIFTLLLALWYMTCIGNSWASYQRQGKSYFLYTLSATAAVLPLLLLLGIILYWVHSKGKSRSVIIRAWRDEYSPLE